MSQSLCWYKTGKRLTHSCFVVYMACRGCGETDAENAEWAGLCAGTRLAEDQPSTRLEEDQRIHALSSMLFLVLDPP